MSTWIAHLRIAEQVIAQLPELDPIAFTFGSLSPDSGVPNADWTVFDPPKRVTHFQEQEKADESTICDLCFYANYLQAEQIEADPVRYSWLLGYFFHLVSDRLWSARVWHVNKKQVERLRAQGLDPYKEIKGDWYTLDQRYVRDHPDHLFWRVYLPAPNPPSYLPFIPESALHQQYDYIRDFYGTPHPNWLLDRAFPYLNEATMTRHVDDTTRALLHIYSAVQANAMPAVEQKTALVLLSPEERAPYAPPLGDV